MCNLSGTFVECRRPGDDRSIDCRPATCASRPSSVNRTAAGKADRRLLAPGAACRSAGRQRRGPGRHADAGRVPPRPPGPRPPALPSGNHGACTGAPAPTCPPFRSTSPSSRSWPTAPLWATVPRCKEREETDGRPADRPCCPVGQRWERGDGRSPAASAPACSPSSSPPSPLCPCRSRTSSPTTARPPTLPSCTPPGPLPKKDTSTPASVGCTLDRLQWKGTWEPRAAVSA